MSRPPSRTVRAGIVLAVVVVLGACTGNDDDASPPNESAAPSAAPTTTAGTTDAAVSEPSAVATTAPATVETASVSSAPVVPAPTGDGCGVLDIDAAAEGTLADLVAATPELSSLAALVEAAGLATDVAGDGQITLVAPTDAAFATLDPITADALAADPAGLGSRVLALHVLDGARPLADLVASSPVSGPTGTITATAVDGGIVVDAGGGPATVTCQDVVTTNGVLHVVDGVLLPPPVDTESVGGSRLARVDPATGAATSAGAFGEELGVLDVVAQDDGTLLALTDAGELLTFSPASPSAAAHRVAITGIEGATLLALDGAPDGTLLGVTDLSGVFRIDPATGAATAVGPGLDPGVDDLGVAADVGTAGALRVVVATGLDVTVDAATGAVAETRPPPVFAPGDPNAGRAARVVAIASTPERLLAIEATTGSLVVLGAEGQLTTIGPLGIDLTDGAGLDAAPDGTLYLTVPG